MRKRRLEQVNDSLGTEECNNSVHEHIPLELETDVEPSIKQNAGDRQIIKHESLGNRTSIE